MTRLAWFSAAVLASVLMAGAWIALYVRSARVPCE